MTTLMRNGRDRRSENPLRATRGKNACFCLGPISGSHQGPQPERLHSEAEYMAAPERFAKRSESSLAPLATSIHGTQQNRARRRLVRSWPKLTCGRKRGILVVDPKRSCAAQVFRSAN